MNDVPDDTLSKRRRSPTRKVAKAPAPVNVPAVQAILDHALHPETVPAADMDLPPAVVQAFEPESDSVPKPPPARRRIKSKPLPPLEVAETEVAGTIADVRTPALAEPPVPESDAAEAAEPLAIGENSVDSAPPETGHNGADQNDRAFVDLLPADSAPPDDGHAPPSAVAPEPSHHHWVYLALAVFLLALGFGSWGIWSTWFASDTPTSQSTDAQRDRTEKLSQEVSTLRRSDQISREANRDLERTLAERDEEIAGLRADVAFYERFVGATGQRRGLSVHDLDMTLQSGDAWHFVATLTQNLNRGAVNAGQVTLSVEGTRNDRLEKLSWSALRKQTNAPGEAYSFKYFQQVEGEIMLPKDFKPLRVAVRLVPAGGSAMEQSFPWPDTVRDGG
jgi:hypothetical protein